MGSPQFHLARTLADPCAVYHVLDATPVPAAVVVRACRRGLFAGQATFGRRASKTEWVYGLKVGPAITPKGVVPAFTLAEASADGRPIGEILMQSDRHTAYLADKGFAPAGWERHWLSEHGASAAAPRGNSKRAWDALGRLWAAGKRQVVEGVISRLKDQFFLERRRAKTLGGLPARLAAKAWRPRPGGQDMCLHVRTISQLPAWSPASPAGRSAGLKSYASVV